MAHLIAINWLCGAIFHGAHVAGHAQWADRKFMVVDFCSVLAASVGAIFTTPMEGRLEYAFFLASAFLIWLLSFGPLRGLPLNPILSLLHAWGNVANWRAGARVCSG